MGHLSNIEIAKVCQTSLCKFAPPDVTEIFIKFKVSVSRKKDEAENAFKRRSQSDFYNHAQAFDHANPNVKKSKTIQEMFDMSHDDYADKCIARFFLMLVYHLFLHVNILIKEMIDTIIQTRTDDKGPIYLIAFLMKNS